MREKCRDRFGLEYLVIDIYEGLSPGLGFASEVGQRQIEIGRIVVSAFVLFRQIIPMFSTEIPRFT